MVNFRRALHRPFVDSVIMNDIFRANSFCYGIAMVEGAPSFLVLRFLDGSAEVSDLSFSGVACNRLIAVNFEAAKLQKVVTHTIRRQRIEDAGVPYVSRKQPFAPTSASVIVTGTEADWLEDEILYRFHTQFADADKETRQVSLDQDLWLQFAAVVLDMRRYVGE